jgi:hypothetical protein
MVTKFFGVRIIALIAAALITAIGMSPYDFLHFTGIGAASATLVDVRGRVRCPVPDTSGRPSCVRV